MLHGWEIRIDRSATKIDRSLAVGLLWRTTRKWSIVTPPLKCPLVTKTNVSNVALSVLYYDRSKMTIIPVFAVFKTPRGRYRAVKPLHVIICTHVYTTCSRYLKLYQFPKQFRRWKILVFFFLYIYVISRTWFKPRVFTCVYTYCTQYAIIFYIYILYVHTQIRPRGASTAVEFAQKHRTNRAYYYNLRFRCQ